MHEMNAIPGWLSAPAAAAYGAAVHLRTHLYRWKLLSTRTLDNPVISVGNITAGGTGKTPIVEQLGRLLTRGGHSVSILSRGYRRHTRGVLPVSRGKELLATPGECGDELEDCTCSLILLSSGGYCRVSRRRLQTVVRWRSHPAAPCACCST